MRVELNHTDQKVLPSGFRLDDNDTRILAVAANLRAEGHAVTVVSKDLPMRVKASALGIDAEEYRAELAVDSGWTGMREIQLDRRADVALWEDERLAALSGRRLRRRPRVAADAHGPRDPLAARLARSGAYRLGRFRSAGARRPRGVRPPRA